MEKRFASIMVDTKGLLRRATLGSRWLRHVIKSLVVATLVRNVALMMVSLEGPGPLLSTTRRVKIGSWPGTKFECRIERLEE